MMIEAKKSQAGHSSVRPSTCSNPEARRAGKVQEKSVTKLL